MKKDFKKLVLELASANSDEDHSSMYVLCGVQMLNWSIYRFRKTLKMMGIHICMNSH